MYKIIGSDQKEYGPITAEELRKWIREGRANSQTKIQAEGSTEWKLLSDFAEFADALSAKTPPSGSGSPPPLAFASEAAGLEYHVDIAKLFQRSWALVKDNFGLVVGATALVLLIQIAVNSIPHLGPIAGAVLLGPLWSGLYTLFLKLIRGQSAALSDAFAGFSADFVQLMLLGIVFHFC